MALTQSSTNHALGSSPGVTAAPGTFFGWFYSAGGQGRYFLTTCNAAGGNGASRKNFRLGLDLVSTSNDVSALTENTSSTQNQALTGAITTNTWQFCAAAFVTTTTNAAYLGTSKNTHAATVVPPSIDSTVLGARQSDFSFGVSGQMAHVGESSGRVLSDLELAYLSASGNPRYIGLSAGNVVRYWECAATETTTITDQCGNENLTVTGLTAGSSDPNVASFWTAAAQGNLSYTQGSAIASITFSTKYRQVSASVDYTVTLNQIGSAGTATSANGAAASASNALTVNAIGSIAAGQYVKIGAGAFNLVLYVSGSTILLATPQTWANTDTVTPYPASALTVNGLSIAAGVFSGTPGAPAVGTYANCVFRAANNTVATAIADSALFTITVASSGAAPSFSAGPTLTGPTTDGYAFGATCNQTATWYAVALLRGSATPTGALVKAGSPTGFVSRFTTALTAATPGTLTFTALTNPTYDLHHVVDNGSGTSAVSSFTNQMKSPPAGTQYVTATVQSITAITQASPARVTSTAHGRTSGDWVQVFGVGGMTQVNGTFVQCTVIDANTVALNSTDSTGFSAYTTGGTLSWGQSIGANSSTAVATNDIWVLNSVTAEDGLPITCFPNGAISIAVGTITRRQSFTGNAYSVSGQALIGANTVYFQNTPPIAPQGSSVNRALFLPANQAITPVNIAALATDLQNDALTVGITGLPAGLSVVSGVLSGTTTGNSNTVITVTWTDVPLESTVIPLNLVIGKVNPPNLTGMNAGDIIDALAALYLTPTFGQQDNAAAAGTAIAQNPTFGVPVDPNTTINVTLSTGITAATLVSVPDVSSAPIDQATAVAAIISAGLVPQVTQPWTGSVQIRQLPTALSQVAQGTLVYLSLLGGSPTQRRKPTPKKRAVIPPPKPRPRVIIKVPK